jgi:hypothetical protein
VTRGAADGHPAWAPGGGRLVFERLVVEPITGAPTRYDICVVSVDGGPVQCLARGPYYHAPSWGR